MHRFFGVARINGTDYIVETLMFEDARDNIDDGIHSYVATEIEVLDEKTPNTPNGVDTPNSELEGYPLAKIIKNVGKAMQPDVLLLNASEEADKEIEKQNNADANIRQNISTEDGSDKKANQPLLSIAPVKTHIDEVSRNTGAATKQVERPDEVDNKEARERIEKGEKVEAYYDENGNLSFYTPNVTSRYRSEQVVMDEVAGQKGMRGLLGEQGYRDFLRNIWYDKSDKEMAEYVNENFWKNGGDIYKAVEDYIQKKIGDAVKSDGNRPDSFWQNVRDYLGEQLNAKGFNFTPSVRDAQYLLWIAKNGNKRGNAWNEVERRNILDKLGVKEPKVVGDKPVNYNPDNVRFSVPRKEDERYMSAVRYIKENGEQAFADKMAKDNQMTIKRK